MGLTAEDIHSSLKQALGSSSCYLPQPFGTLKKNQAYTVHLSSLNLLNFHHESGARMVENDLVEKCPRMASLSLFEGEAKPEDVICSPKFFVPLPFSNSWI
jgi:hypothetical protein